MDNDTRSTLGKRPIETEGKIQVTASDNPFALTTIARTNRGQPGQGGRAKKVVARRSQSSKELRPRSP